MTDKQTLPYRVVGIDEQYKVDKTGKLVLMKVAHYETAIGDTGTVSMPVDGFDADIMTSMIEQDVAHIAKLHGIE